MRILLVSGSLTPDRCGVGDYTHQLAEALSADPADAVAVLTGAEESVGHEAIARRYQLLRPVRDWGAAEAGRLYRAIRAWRPDVVHVQYPTQGYRGGWLASLVGSIAALTGASVVRTWHEGFTKGQGLRLLAQSLSPGPFVVVRPDFARHVSRLLHPVIAKRRRSVILGASAIPQTGLDDAALVAHRAELLGHAQRLIVFFGFLYPKKGVERLFDAADPATDRIVIAGEDGVDPAYAAMIRERAGTPPWRGRAAVLGGLAAERVADLLAAADAVVLPFTDGGGSWNSSIHAAVRQGTPVVTTTMGPETWSDDGLIHYVPANDGPALRAALGRVPPWRAGRLPAVEDEWARVAREHREVYREAVGKPVVKSGAGR